METHKWLKTNTYHHSDLPGVAELAEEKKKRNLRISLCIPALNEEDTIGKEIVLLKSELMTRHQLLDELAVIDSGSEDATREVARAFGADVYLASEILPEEGDKRGKGENLWKAIYQLEGDIIVYLDADIKNIHPKFAYGLLAPLILREEVKYVKAFYERPLVMSGGIRPSGGGRVTEILVRPLFSLFFPQLTVFLQPLSGEYAVRREVLERIAFPVGYGVETSHLIDVLQLYGLEAFAQVDLDQRVHKNQPTRALGKMAFGILQTFLSRLKMHGMIAELPETDSILRQFQSKGAEHEQVEFELSIMERPPMLEIEAYRKKFGRDRTMPAEKPD